MIEAPAPIMAAPALKLKPRKLSVARRWPKGCGRFPATADPKPIAMAPDPGLDPDGAIRASVGPVLPPVVELVRVRVSSREAAAGTSESNKMAGASPLEEKHGSNGSLEEKIKGSETLLGVEIRPPEERVDGSSEQAAKDLVENGIESSSDQAEKFENLECQLNGFGGEKRWLTSKIYPPPKRRAVSAIRRFPVGCARNNTTRTSKEKCPKAADSNKNSNGEKKSEGNQQAASEVSGQIVLVEKPESKSSLDGGDKSETSRKTGKELDLQDFSSESMKDKTNLDNSKMLEADINTSSLVSVKAVSIEKLKGESMDGERKFGAKVASLEKVRNKSPNGGERSLVISQKKAEKSIEALSIEKIVKKDRIDFVKSVDAVPRKLRQDADDQSEGDASLDAYSETVIVQALMSAKNCPWRQSKRTSFGNSPSSSSKIKVKKDARVLNKKLASRGESVSRPVDELKEEDEEDVMPQDYENAKALTMYQGKHELTTYEGKRELSVNITPCVPIEWNRKGSDKKHIDDRTKVRRILRLFQLVCRKLLKGEEAKSTKESGKIGRIDLEAAAVLKRCNEYVNSGEAVLGNVPGVEVGDEFHYRVELSIVGLHRPYQGGIDSVVKNGLRLATSIVASGGYPDDIDSSDILIYSGAGGKPAGKKEAEDQKLERGNLALKNSIDMQTPVRVIHGFKEHKGSDSSDGRIKMVSTFTYAGLYLVEKYWSEKGPHGVSVFKFQLRRMPGQPELALNVVNKTKRLKVREGLCVRDISQGKEKIPICAVNTIDDERPPPFQYITKIIYPPWYAKTRPMGCDCSGGCSDSAKCACAMKNGGEIPFNFNGAIVQAKPLIYECGPNCKCPPSCHNRVSQHGIKIQLEIFKTLSRGWGVRSLSSIPSGSFICEYVGELLQDKEAEQRSNDDYLFDIGHNYDDQSLWEGLPSIIPGLQSSSNCDTVQDKGFTIDAAECGNVGRFINHSCSPNLYAQNVLYDHDDKRMPHIMFFAAENIPPLQELTYHYNYMIDQVRDSDGNIKRKDCFCGSHDCSGRLY
ncbi:histone-lysine N-methyltransferase, H3 lysine-9 specific SUVH6-like [Ananas comosus]|uniref:Histone-lysine N-methyltransferase, H3 lysine-9 specific SUVH6-like n=1 Tax=Ananas comosus TaxID=4615 RepID=A0A6P5G3P2_ANACO|nr:histone-lysine N-methyltransferase, H3 lysine-9 specific SUVH6-like [Ananas comosus]